MSGFIDCNGLRTYRPNGGSLGDDKGAFRWPNDVQFFCNGWYKHHSRTPISMQRIACSFPLNGTVELQRLCLILWKFESL